MTHDGTTIETRGKEASAQPSQTDPRILAFVRLLAQRAAEHDYARFIEAHSKAQTTKKKD